MILIIPKLLKKYTDSLITLQWFGSIHPKSYDQSDVEYLLDKDYLKTV